MLRPITRVPLRLGPPTPLPTHERALADVKSSAVRRNYARLQRQAEKSAASRRGSRVPPDEKGVAKEAKTQETVAGEGKTSSEHGKPVAGKDKESPRKRRCGTRKCGSSKGKSSGSKSK
ncbi:hypothetical protein DCS_07264 [Drechmeria coniospora]|uniref:Uncharacterized protein n=1 Tax=Drechmeria coniospora TaxID=98403 RepID=A0A151GE14_DRECN|nr:hypothetical protein DCS_07264 [Drechmeria coniospora]KYK55301.1 hypothetical protein DCS_07264 [Drechmeria coniospora]ODA82084.1 hypothetical protein RJ55_00589 [Drechmeria coniospora]